MPTPDGWYVEHEVSQITGFALTGKTQMVAIEGGCFFKIAGGYWVWSRQAEAGSGSPDGRS